MTVQTDPNFLDVDALSPKIERSLKIEGEVHILKPLDVEGWLANLDLVDRLQAFLNAKSRTPAEIARENLNVSVKVLCRAFPTLKEAVLRRQKIENLDAITLWVKAFDGSEEIIKEAAKEASENPQDQPSLPGLTAS